MTTVEASVVVNAGAAEVWKFITDLSNSPTLYPNVLGLKQTSAGPWGKDAVFSGQQGRWAIVSKVTEFEPSRKFAFEFLSPGFVKGSTMSYILQSLEGKTRLTETLEMRLSGFYRLVRPFLIRTARKEAEARHARLKQALESREQ